jgi:hypothetical protein
MDSHYELDVKDGGFTYELDEDDWEVDEYAKGRFDKIYASQIPSDNPRQLYFRVKKYVELFIAQLRSPFCYLYLTPAEKTHQFIKKGELLEMLSSLPRCSLTPVISDKMPDFCQLWVKDPYMRSYDRVDYIPYNMDNGECPLNVFNLFTGFSDHIHAKYDKKDTDDLLTPFYKLLSSVSEHNSDVINYNENWIAHIIQKPAEKVPTALVLTGNQGTGKNVFVNMIRNLIGEGNFYTTADLKSLFGNHASGMYHKLLVNADEVNLANAAQYTERMKQAITQDDLNVNLKNVQEFTVKAPCRFIFTSNNPNPVRIDVQRTMNSSDWDDMVNHFKKPEFISCLYDRLMSLEIDGFQWINGRPNTQARDLLYESSVPAHVNFLVDYIETFHERMPEYEMNPQVFEDVTRSDLYSRFQYWAKQNGTDELKVPTSMAFRTRVKGISLPMDDKVNKGTRYYRFNPFVVREALKERYPFMY